METSDLRKAGLKITLPRLKILEILGTATPRHMSAEDIYKHLLESHEDIGLATVYRVLTQFEAAGLVTRHHFEGTTAVFELNQGEHHLAVLPGMLTDISQLQSDVLGINGSITNLDGRLDTVEDDVLALDGRTDALESTVGGLVTDVAQNTSDIDALELLTGTLGGDLDALELSVGTLSTGLSTAQSDIAGLTGDVATLETDLLDVQSTVAILCGVAILGNPC